MNEAHLGTFFERFTNNKSAYYQQWSNGTEYGYKAVYSPVIPRIIAQHLSGDLTLSMPALDENNCGKWICFDSDIEDDSLNILAAFLQEYGWHIIHEGKRPGRDGHLWLLLNYPIAGEHLINLGDAIARLAGVKNSGIELFPKQTKADKLASAVRLPLGIHRKPGAHNCRGLFESCPEKDIETQLAWLAAQPLNDAVRAIELAKQHAPLVLPPIRRRLSVVYTGQVNFKQIRQAALFQAKNIIDAWLPGGKGSTHYTALNPRRSDNHAGSFTINLRTGIWKDFATKDGGGDLISLVAYLDGCSQLEAAKKLATVIGWTHKESA